MWVDIYSVGKPRRLGTVQCTWFDWPFTDHSGYEFQLRWNPTEFEAGIPSDESSHSPSGPRSNRLRLIRGCNPAVNLGAYRSVAVPVRSADLSRARHILSAGTHRKGSDPTPESAVPPNPVLFD